MGSKEYVHHVFHFEFDECSNEIGKVYWNIIIIKWQYNANTHILTRSFCDANAISLSSKTNKTYYIECRCQFIVSFV